MHIISSLLSELEMEYNKWNNGINQIKEKDMNWSEFGSVRNNEQFKNDADIIIFPDFFKDNFQSIVDVISWQLRFIFGNNCFRNKSL